MESVKLLDYTEKPLYQNLRDILLQGLKAIGSKDDGKLDFSAVENGSVKTKPASKVGLDYCCFHLSGSTCRQGLAQQGS